jgi:hypothetical protein
MGLRHIPDYVYNTVAGKNPQISTTLKKSANIMMTPKAINIYRFMDIIKVVNFKVITCVCVCL